MSDSESFQKDKEKRRTNSKFYWRLARRTNSRKRKRAKGLVVSGRAKAHEPTSQQHGPCRRSRLDGMRADSVRGRCRHSLACRAARWALGPLRVPERRSPGSRVSSASASGSAPRRPRRLTVPWRRPTRIAESGAWLLCRPRLTQAWASRLQRTLGGHGLDSWGASNPEVSGDPGRKLASVPFDLTLWSLKVDIKFRMLSRARALSFPFPFGARTRTPARLTILAGC